MRTLSCPLAGVLRRPCTRVQERRDGAGILGEAEHGFQHKKHDSGGHHRDDLRAAPRPKKRVKVTCATLQWGSALNTACQSNTISTLVTHILIPLMSVQDRTHEFKSCVDSIRNRTALGNRGMEAKQRLLQNKPGQKSEFSRMASSIGKEDQQYLYQTE